RVLLRRPGVIVRPDAREVAVDREGVAPGSPLEHHVLEEVRDSRDLRGLIARPGLDPECDRDRQRCRIRLAEDRQAVGELMLLEGHEVSDEEPRNTRITRNRETNSIAFMSSFSCRSCVSWFNSNAKPPGRG